MGRKLEPGATAGRGTSQLCRGVVGSCLLFSPLHPEGMNRSGLLARPRPTYQSVAENSPNARIHTHTLSHSLSQISVVTGVHLRLRRYSDHSRTLHTRQKEWAERRGRLREGGGGGLLPKAPGGRMGVRERILWTKGLLTTQSEAGPRASSTIKGGSGFSVWA